MNIEEEVKRALDGSKMSIGPTDFLFCQICNAHVGNHFYFADSEIEVVRERTTDEKKARVAPVIAIKMKPHCSACGSRLIQQYVSVTITIPAEK